MTEESVQQCVIETRGLQRLNTVTARLSSCGLSEKDVQNQTTAISLVHVLVVVPKRCRPPVGCVTVGFTPNMSMYTASLVAFWNALKATSTKVVLQMMRSRYQKEQIILIIWGSALVYIFVIAIRAMESLFGYFPRWEQCLATCDNSGQRRNRQNEFRILRPVVFCTPWSDGGV